MYFLFGHCRGYCWIFFFKQWGIVFELSIPKKGFIIFGIFRILKEDFIVRPDLNGDFLLCYSEFMHNLNFDIQSFNLLVGLTSPQSNTVGYRWLFVIFLKEIPVNTAFLNFELWLHD